MNRKTKQAVTLTLAAIIIILATGAIITYIQTQPNNHQNPSKPLKVACVGDSITANFGYPENLQKLLGENYTVENFGMGGTTVLLDGQTPYMYDHVFMEAKASQPDIVVIMLGTNDALPSLHQYSGNFVNDYITLVNELQNLPSKPQIWIVKSPPIFNNGTGLSPEFFSQTIIPKIGEVAEKTALPLIDVYSALADASASFYDGVHPDSEASMLIANEIYKSISQK